MFKVQSSCNISLNEDEKIFEITTLLGSRDYEDFYELISRGVLEILNNDELLLNARKEKEMVIKNFINPFKGKPLLFSFALNMKELDEKLEEFLFKNIISSIKGKIINLLI